MMLSQGKIDCAPAEVGYDANRLHNLNSHFHRIIKEKKIQCASYCITLKGKVIAHNGIGKQSFSVDDERTVPYDAIHYIASMTKPFVAVAIMKLVEDGLIRLDQRVCEILPQFEAPPYNQVTLFGLLTHTSGMHPDTGCFPDDTTVSPCELIERGYKNHKDEDGKFDWITASLKNWVRTESGKEWCYCSYGYTILGAVIEKVTGIKAETYIEDNICKPLGMIDTAFKFEPNKKDRWIIQNGARMTKRLLGLSEDENDKEPWSKVPQTAGGLNSTAYDMTIFGNCMLNNGTLNGVRILGKKAAEKMTAAAIHNIPDYCWGARTPSRGYGIGFDMRSGPAFMFSDGTFNHEGAGACAMYVDPAEKLVAAWLVPWVNVNEWHGEALWNALNIIWSGLV